MVILARAARYFGIAYLAGHYGRHFLRVLRHPMQHWGWMLLFVIITVLLIVGGLIASHRLETAEASN